MTSLQRLILKGRNVGGRWAKQGEQAFGTQGTTLVNGIIPPPSEKKKTGKILLPLKMAGQIPLPLEKENNGVNETKR